MWTLRTLHVDAEAAPPECGSDAHVHYYGKQERPGREPTLMLIINVSSHLS
jgi:hypothetical protein